MSFIPMQQPSPAYQNLLSTQQNQIRDLNMKHEQERQQFLIAEQQAMERARIAAMNRTELLGNQELPVDHRINSPSGAYFIMQGDGNAVLYTANQRPIFDTKTNGKGPGPHRLCCQGDGNIVVYDSQNHPQWASNSAGKGQGPFRLVLQGDNNLVCYGNGQPVWASNTAGQY